MRYATRSNSKDHAMTNPEDGLGTGRRVSKGKKEPSTKRARPINFKRWMDDHGIALIDGLDALSDISGVRHEEVHPVVRHEVPFFQEMEYGPDEKPRRRKKAVKINVLESPEITHRRVAVADMKSLCGNANPLGDAVRA